MNTTNKSDPKAVLSTVSLTKRYGATLALDSVSFDLREGEIHALLGENGAGKSTLMKILSGLTRPSSGSIRMRDELVRFSGPESAARSGIGMVHQHFLLVPAFTVLENLSLDDSGRRRGLLRADAVVAGRAASIMDRVGWKIPLDVRISDLPVGTQQRVEILKTLLADARILLFDEPTAVLAPSEITSLFEVLRGLRAEGRSIVFVSHKLGEVMALCDQVTVLRRGKNAGSVDVAETNVNDLARRMVGSDPLPAEIGDGASDSSNASKIDHKSRKATVELKGVSTRSTDRSVALRDISFTLRQGEVLGFAGVDGNGQTELAELLTGTRPWRSGTVRLDGAPVKRLRAGDLVHLGIGYIPPDRHREGLALSLSVAENLALDAAQMPRFYRGPFLNFGAMKSFAVETAAAFDVRAERLDLPTSSLSGGNQQKIVIARALWRKPEVLIAVSPTRGLDVAATAYVHQQIRRRRQEGGAILLISTELDEVIALSDRIAVLYDGQIAGIVPSGTSREAIGLLMGGQFAKDASKDNQKAQVARGGAGE